MEVGTIIKLLALGTLALALVACGTAAEPQVTAVPEQVSGGATTNTNNARIADLEAQLAALRWTEEDAISVAQNKLREKVRYCQSNYCDYRKDPVMRALGVKGRPAGFFDFALSLAKSNLEHGKWTAVYEPDSLRWLVIATGGDSPPMTSYAYERTGLVEGIAP